MSNATKNSAGGNASAVTFASRSPNFTLFLDSGRPVPGPNGQIEYRDRVTVRFQNNRYSTSDAAIIAAMRKCKSYKTQFQEIETEAEKPATGDAGNKAA